MFTQIPHQHFPCTPARVCIGCSAQWDGWSIFYSCDGSDYCVRCKTELEPMIQKEPLQATTPHHQLRQFDSNRY
jgi:ferredoxin